MVVVLRNGVSPLPAHIVCVTPLLYPPSASAPWPSKGLSRPPSDLRKASRRPFEARGDYTAFPSLRKLPTCDWKVLLVLSVRSGQVR